MSELKVAFLVSDEGIERVELTTPWEAVQDAGHQPVLIGLKPGTAQTVNHTEPARAERVDAVVRDVEVGQFAALVLPGGVLNPDNLRQDERAVAFVRDFVDSGKPVAAICHAPWVLVEAGVVSGRHLTSYPSVSTDVKNAGGLWEDSPVVVDDNLITSRNPDDLPAFTEAILKALGA